MRTIPDGRFGGVLTTALTGPPRPAPIVVRAPKELDVESGPRLVATVERVVAFPPATDVHVLLDALEFVDVAGIRALLRCRDVVRDHGASLVFLDVPPLLDRMLRLVPELRARFEEA